MSRLFGTDGVRGVANSELTPLLAMQLGQAGAFVLLANHISAATIIRLRKKPVSALAGNNVACLVIGGPGQIRPASPTGRRACGCSFKA